MALSDAPPLRELPLVSASERGPVIEWRGYDDIFTCRDIGSTVTICSVYHRKCIYACDGSWTEQHECNPSIAAFTRTLCIGLRFPNR